MPCLFALGAACFPRLALLSLWVFTPLVTRAFHAMIALPLLGAIFLPYTTLLFVIAWSTPVGIVGGVWLWVLLGFLIDFSSYATSGYATRNRAAHAPSF